MAQYYQNQYSQPQTAQNLQFYPSSYGPTPVSGHTTPSQASYGGYGGVAPSNAAPAYPAYGGGAGFGGPAVGVSGRMGEQGGLRTGWLAAFGTEGYDGEPPLLEELGVNFDHIRTKVSCRSPFHRVCIPGCAVLTSELLQTLTVLNPLTSPSPHIMDDSDLYGALLFLILYGTFLALSGKFFYGYIYGIALFGSLALHFVFSLMTPVDQDPTSSMSPSGPDPTTMNHTHGLNEPQGGGVAGGHFSSTLTYSRSASVLGYCFLPLTFTALLGVLLPMDSLLGYIITSLAVAWSTYSSSGMFISVGRMRGMRGLVAYPLALFYVGFGIMGIFSSRGTGPLQRGMS